MKFIARTFLSFFGVGFLPFAPGTFGSLAAAIAIYFWQPTILPLEIFPKVTILFAMISLIFLSGWFLIPLALKKDFDQKWIVLDEVVGMLVASTPLFFQSKNFLIELIFAFALFRFFDISKFGSRKIDALGTPISVFADDLAAGIYAAFVLVLIQFLW